LVKQRQGAIKKILKPIFYLVGIVGVSLGLLQTVFDVGVSGLLNRLVEGFQFSDDLGAILRREQYTALLNGWANTPFFGAGLGAVAEGSIRSPEMPWSYELYFLSMLFHTGIVGIAAYATGIGWIVFHGLRIVRRDPALRLYMVPVLVGMICFLIASNTNPYLAKFDYLWIIFLPVAIINHSLLKGSAPRPGVPGE
jgi:O-antigen ligase